MNGQLFRVIVVFSLAGLTTKNIERVKLNCQLVAKNHGYHNHRVSEEEGRLTFSIDYGPCCPGIAFAMAQALASRVQYHCEMFDIAVRVLDCQSQAISAKPETEEA